MEEEALRETLSTAIRGALVILVLTILRSIAFKLPGVDTMIGSLNAGGYFYVALTVAILVVLLRIFEPLKSIVGYYLAIVIKVGRIPGREQYVKHLVPLSGTIVLLVYVIVVYQYLSPVVVILNEAFLRFGDGVYKALGLSAVAIGALCLWRLWQQSAPLIDLFSGKLSATTAAATTRMVTIPCPSCGTPSDRDQKFCPSCGATLAAPASIASEVPPPVARACAKCGTILAERARFCGECGAAG